tara:strand:- start:648 stop:842 length:195 start_codon:yes stop_codon:yes gene_type:complete
MPRTIEEIMESIDNRRNILNTDQDYKEVAEELENAPSTIREAIEGGDEALAEEVFTDLSAARLR